MKPQINFTGEDLVVKMPQEDNYAENFPRQLLEFVVPGGDLSKNHDLVELQEENNETFYQKVISVRFESETQNEKWFKLNIYKYSNKWTRYLMYIKF